MKQRSNPQAGFSLIGVLVVMGVLLSTVLLVTQTKVRTQRAQKALKVKRSYADINQDLLSSVTEIFHKNLSRNCDGLLQAHMSRWQELDGAVRFRFANSVKVATPSDQSKMAMVPQLHLEAQARCRSARSPNGGNRFYFCVEMHGDKTAPTDSILNAEAAFAEFAVELVDLQTQTPISCAEYESRRDDKDSLTKESRNETAGLAVTMILYWANRIGAGPDNFTYSQKPLYYLINLN